MVNTFLNFNYHRLNVSDNCIIYDTTEKKLAEEEEERLNKLEDEARIAKGKKPKKRKPKVVEAKKKVIEDEIDGSGIEVMFDNAKMMFILSDRSEDMLIMSLKHNEAATYHIHHSLVRIGTSKVYI